MLGVQKRFLSPVKKKYKEYDRHRRLNALIDRYSGNCDDFSSLNERAILKNSSATSRKKKNSDTETQYNKLKAITYIDLSQLKHITLADVFHQFHFFRLPFPFPICLIHLEVVTLVSIQIKHYKLSVFSPSVLIWLPRVF